MCESVTFPAMKAMVSSWSSSSSPAIIRGTAWPTYVLRRPTLRAHTHFLYRSRFGFFLMNNHEVFILTHIHKKCLNFTVARLGSVICPESGSASARKNQKEFPDSLGGQKTVQQKGEAFAFTSSRTSSAVQLGHLVTDRPLPDLCRSREVEGQWPKKGKKKT